MVTFNQHRKVTRMRGWCIPAQGKDYEVKEKDAFEISLPKISGSELISDVKDRVLQIPAAEPGNIVGYEYETEESPLVLQTVWQFQTMIRLRMRSLLCNCRRPGNLPRFGEITLRAKTHRQETISGSGC